MSGKLKLVLILAVLATNLLVSGMLAYMLSAAKAQREDVIRTNIENVASLLDFSITETVDKIDISLRATADELEDTLQRHERLENLDVNELLDDRRKWLSKLATTIRVTDASGTVRYCSGCAPGDKDTFVGHDFIANRSSQITKKLMVTNMLADRAPNNWTVQFTQRYDYPDGRFAGVVIATVPASSFAQLFTNINLGPHGMAVLRDANMAIIVRYPSVADSSQQIGSKVHSKELARVVTSGDAAGIFHTKSSGDGVERTLAYRRLSVVPFHLVAGLGTEDYLAEWRDLARRTIAAAVIFFAATIALAWFLWRTQVANARSRLLLRNASDGIHILDAGHNVIEANDAFCRMLGYTPAEMVGMNASQWVVRSLEADPIQFVSNVDDHFEVLLFEARFRRKDGSFLDVEITVRQMELAGQKMLFCAARDITERKRTEQALIESEARFRKLFEENRSVMLLVDPPSGEIVAANPAASSYYGYQSECLIGMSVNQLNILPADEVLLERQKALREERGYFNFRHRLASGQERDVEVYSAPLDVDGKSLLFSIVHDISDRKMAEARAKRLSNLYAALSQCNQAIVHCVNEDELFPKICQCAVEYGFVKTAWIGLVDKASNRLKPVAWYGDDASLKFLDISSLTVDVSDPLGLPMSGKAICDNQPQWCQDFLQDPVVVRWHEYGRNAGWRSLASLPLCRNGVPVGCLVIYSDIVNAFDEDARKLLIEMAMDISFALDNFAREADRRQSAEALRVSEARYRLIFQTSQDAIAINRIDDGGYIDINRGFTTMTDFAWEDVARRSSMDIKIWANLEDRLSVIERLREAPSCQNIEVQFRKKNGELFWGVLSASVIELDGESCILSVTRDISDIKVAEDEIKTLAFYDSLTRLPNRRLLTDRLHHVLAVTARNKRKCALLFIDLDDFKMLNDTRGHAIGDSLLQEVAKRLTASVRDGDTVARLGGDEFIVLAEDLSENKEEAAALAQNIGEKILAVIAQPFWLVGRECRISTSIGIILFGGEPESSENLLMQADIAMYQAKSAGRNTIRFFSPDLQADINFRVSMENDLHQAIENQEFLLHYQPQGEYGDLVGAEVLIRWNHPERGIVAPGEFIPVAEETENG